MSVFNFLVWITEFFFIYSLFDQHGWDILRSKFLRVLNYFFNCICPLRRPTKFVGNFCFFLSICPCSINTYQALAQNRLRIFFLLIILCCILNVKHKYNEISLYYLISAWMVSEILHIYILILLLMRMFFFPPDELTSIILFMLIWTVVWAAFLRNSSNLFAGN